MAIKNLLFDTTILPTEVLSFYDDKFFNMVERVAGSAEAKLLAAQGIRSLYSFLNTEDVFEILSISCSALNDIKGLVCLKADDDTYIVKLGCRASIQYLYQLLKQKHEEILKVNRMKFKQNQQSQSQISVKTITILSKIHRKMTRHYLLSNNHQQRQQQQQQVNHYFTIDFSFTMRNSDFN
ncbi:unnamed protein product [Rotaria socialis]|uniref:Uncharacterized protein n=1 Tax=Rotaria socialis TaxID=392032 RepID=A0A818L724_9BILA|nr:unnamed protein product [Rotaria socialis]CAF3394100.1 unnamed protein product [Rotaria socialis]CAF3572307.1 unnamed protein product [Rotaria socialis]CAF3726284.1 unnamed protein product [Rotaria socialis]CAF4399350.1 unnamed protein product [Rotaria socialis]